MNKKILTIKNLIYEYELKKEKEQRLTSWIEGLKSGSIEPRVGRSRTAGIIEPTEDLSKEIAEVLIDLFTRKRKEVKKESEKLEKEILNKEDSHGKIPE